MILTDALLADDDLVDDIINDYSDDSQTKPPRSEGSKQEVESGSPDGCLIPPVVPRIPKDARYAEVGPHEDSPEMLKKEFEAALRERELAQKKLEELADKFKGFQQR